MLWYHNESLSFVIYTLVNNIKTKSILGIIIVFKLNDKNYIIYTRQQKARCHKIPSNEIPTKNLQPNHEEEIGKTNENYTPGKNSCDKSRKRAVVRTHAFSLHGESTLYQFIDVGRMRMNGDSFEHAEVILKSGD